MAPIKASRSKKYLVAVALAAALAVGGLYLWRYLRPREIKLLVVSDYAFRERSNWDTVLDQRFAALNQIFHGTGVVWRVVNADHLDPVSDIPALDLRRLELERREASSADVVVSVTGQGEGDRLGSVNAFSHAVVVVDFPQQSEQQNTINLAQELARLFGSPLEPAGSGSVMAVPPRNATLAPQTAALIRQLRDYNFAAGIGALDDKWRRRAAQALEKAYTRPSPKPRAHAYTTLALALDVEKHAAEAVPLAREAVKADPQSVDAHEALAHALRDDLQTDAAVRELRDALKLFPNNPPLHAMLGSVLGTQSETDEALKELRVAESLDPKNANYPITLGSILVSQTGQLDEAMAEFQKAARLDPSLATAQYWLRRMEELSTQATHDLESDRKREREAPQDAEAHFRVGVDEARLGHHEAARLEFQKSVDLNPRHGRAFANLAAMEYYSADYDAAWRHVKAARAVGFEPPTALIVALERRRKMPAGDSSQAPAGRAKN